MRISTRNTNKGRSIVRADRPLNPHSFGYVRWGDGQGALKVSAAGSDGRTYTIELSDADIDALRVAREELYPDCFKRERT